MIKRIKSSLLAKVFIITVLLLVGVSFLVYGVLAWFMPETYSNELNESLDEQTRAFIAELSQMSMGESVYLFDWFLGNTNIDHMELFGHDGRQIDLLGKDRESFNDAVTELVAQDTAWNNEMEGVKNFVSMKNEIP